MTMPSWPADLPAKPLVDHYQENIGDTVIRSKMDQGPAKTRQRSSAGVSELTVSYLLSGAQTGVLETFYMTTLAGGSARFAYIHPRRDVEVSARFRKPPQLVACNGQYYTVRLELEILP